MLAVKAEDGYSKARMDSVVGFYHVGLLFRKKAVLGRKKAGDPSADADEFFRKRF
jgi:hypothetical protein